MISNYSIRSNEHLFRILVCTDTHIGYKERDNMRCNDSFEVFEEILRMATALKVDFILHAGDLFDSHTPSRSTLYRTMCILRKFHYDNENKDITYEILNDKTSKCISKCNINSVNSKQIKSNTIPIYGIHGNHDDPIEEAFLSSLDILDASSLITYFGWVDNIDNIQIVPILFRKGKTKIAVYGMGNIRDERLYRAFLSGKVHFLPPEIGEYSDYFNIMLIHQNRYKGSHGGLPNKNCIHEQMLPNFLDIVVWGHEHDSIVSVNQSMIGNYHLFQPGSSIATSLTVGESAKKHVLLLEIKKDKFRSSFMPLYSVRPLYVSDVSLESSGCSIQSESDIINYLTQKVNQSIEISKLNWIEHQNNWKKTIISNTESIYEGKTEFITDYIDWVMSRQILGINSADGSNDTPLPLIRLKVEYTGFDPISNQKFGAQFIGIVANPDDILLFFKKHKFQRDTKENNGHPANHPELEITDTVSFSGHDIQELVFKYLDNRKASLELFPEPEINLAVQNFVHKMESTAIVRFVDRLIENTQKNLKKVINVDSTADTIRNMIKSITEETRRLYVTQKRNEVQNNILSNDTNEILENSDDKESECLKILNDCDIMHNDANQSIIKTNKIQNVNISNSPIWESKPCANKKLLKNNNISPKQDTKLRKKRQFSVVLPLNTNNNSDELKVNSTTVYNKSPYNDSIETNLDHEQMYKIHIADTNAVESEILNDLIPKSNKQSEENSTYKSNIENELKELFDDIDMLLPNSKI